MIDQADPVQALLDRIALHEQRGAALVPLTRAECQVVQVMAQALKARQEAPQAPPEGTPATDALEEAVAGLQAARQRVSDLEGLVRALGFGLAFYARPETWHGLTILPNRVHRAPLMRDWAECKGRNGAIKRVPGKLARLLLERAKETLGWDDAAVDRALARAR